jgi:hypothetical protein
MQMRPSQLSRAVAVACAVVAAPGCGGSSTPPSAPALPHDLGAALARRASSIEASLRGGQSCLASRQVAALQAEVQTAITQGDVPGTLVRPLARSVGLLAARVHCTPTPATDRQRGNGHGRGHHRGREKGGD